MIKLSQFVVTIMHVQVRFCNTLLLKNVATTNFDNIPWKRLTIQNQDLHRRFLFQRPNSHKRSEPSHWTNADGILTAMDQHQLYTRTCELDR